MPPSRRAWALVFIAATLPWAQARADEAAVVRSLISGGDLPGALARVQKAQQSNPRDAQLKFLRGIVLMDLHRDAEAMAVFVEMSQAFPELPDPFNNIAVLEVRAGHLDDAERALRTALRNDPGHRAARVNLGQVQLMLAIQAWQSAAAEGPADPALQIKLELARSLVTGPTPNKP